MLGHRRRSGQVIASGLESVLVGHPVDGDFDSVGRRVRIRSLGDGAFLFADLLLFASFLYLDAVRSFVPFC